MWGHFPPVGVNRISMDEGVRAGIDRGERANVSQTSSGLTAGLRELVDLALVERCDEGTYDLGEGLR